MSTNKETDKKQAPMRPHIVDGIQECDNPLPKWWVGLFIVTIIFAFAYMGYYHLMDRPDHIEHFETAMDARRAKEAAFAQQDHSQGLAMRMQDKEFIKEGLEIFSTNCSPCHGVNGEGGIGANLTDHYWIHGGSAADIVKVIENGALEKGMPAWKDILGQKKIEQVTALIVSWRGKDLPGKAAEGELYTPEK